MPTVPTVPTVPLIKLSIHLCNGWNENEIWTKKWNWNSSTMLAISAGQNHSLIVYLLRTC